MEIQAARVNDVSFMDVIVQVYHVQVEILYFISYCGVRLE